MSRITTTAGRSSLSLVRWPATTLARCADYIELTKPRIVALELVTVVVAFHLAMPWSLNPWLLLHTVLGAGLVAASAGAFNQWWEQAVDARMNRTADRPLPAGRLASWQVVTFGLVTLAWGIFEMIVFVGLLTAVVALATWALYVLVYTPLKTRSPLNTTVGAVSGALPILIGWTATGAAIDMRAWALVAVVFLWQFPHFIAIAWLYREDYRQAGQRMISVVDPTGLRAGGWAVAGALALLPVSLVLALSPQAGSPIVYGGWTMVLGIVQIIAAVAFLARRDDHSARWLLRASLVYLPCWMGLLMMVAI